MWLFVGFMSLLPFLAANDYEMHEIHSYSREKRSILDQQYNQEKSSTFWKQKGQESLLHRLTIRRNEKMAKNVIMFVGDGMSIPTLSAARAYLGGEEKELSFDSFPYSAFSKTYCVDSQVADSACSATAYLCGVKANRGTVGVSAAVPFKDCAATANATHRAPSLAAWAQRAGRRTGLVTTSRVTHATPAALYAHSASRHWESDADVAKDAAACRDIAAQLVEGATGGALNVVLGGGRANFKPKAGGGHRIDHKDLVQTWKTLHPSGVYVKDLHQLEAVTNNDHVLGLFNDEHMEYNIKRDPTVEPSLAEMVAKAIHLLDVEVNGYFLFVEGAKIDMAHHNTYAQMALNETVELSRAVRRALDLTSDEETLVVVTADHAHTMSYAGYGARGTNVLGLAGEADDKMPYAVLNYANGPGLKRSTRNMDKAARANNMLDPDFRFPSAVPLKTETHGGDDVAVFAKGPWSHLFSGVLEQNVLPELIAFAMCIGDGLKACDLKKESN